MAVPSRKKSSTRTRNGRSVKSLNFKKRISLKPKVICNNCQNIQLLHHICLNCYKNKNKK